MTNTRRAHQEFRPIFVDLLPDTASINDSELWISHKHRTVNLRCPCGCGHLTVLSLHPSRWHVHFDGKTVSLNGPTGGSIWANSGCGSHYFIKRNTVVWAEPIDPAFHPEYEYVEHTRLIASQPYDTPVRSWRSRIFRILSPRKRRKFDGPAGRRNPS